MRKIRKNRGGLIRRAMVLVSLYLAMILSCVLEAEAQTGVIRVLGGNQTLNITTAVAGSEPLPVVNTSSTLRYWRQNTNNFTKVTVRTSCPGQSFNLRVLATGVTRGVAAPEVNLVDGMLAVDFITNIQNQRPPNWTSDTITLRYTASATFAQGNSAEMGNDVHTVTYTLQVQ